MNDVLRSWLGRETGHNFAWIGQETGHNLAWLGLSSELSIRWGLTLLHFLWQGALIGVLVFVAAGLLRHQTAVVRYWLHTVALMACPLSVAMTFALVEIPEAFRVAALSEPPAIMETAASPANGNLTSLEMPYPKLLPENSNTASEIVAVTPAAGMPQTPDSTQRFSEATPSGNLFSLWLPVMAQWMTALYAAGVFCFLIRLGVALHGGQRLRAISKPLSDSAFLNLVRDQAKRIGLRMVPVVAYCERVAVPTVIGVLRPMVLLPATLTTGLSLDEFSAILSHELAHIRRYDLWINLLQRVIESLLFFHPVVWFLSRRLSTEREICCDDLVVRSGYEPMNYAGALLRMAELCVSRNGSKLATLSADGNSRSELEHRILQLMNRRHESRLRLTRAGVMIIVIAVFSSAAAPAIFSALAQSDVSSESRATDDHDRVDPRETDKGHIAPPNGPGESIADEAKQRIEPISITGTVLDSKGNQVSGVRVFAVSSEHGAYRKMAETVSNEDGKYELIELQLPIVSAEEDGFLKKAHGAFEVFAMSEELGFTWRSSRRFYPDSEPFTTHPHGDETAAENEGDLQVPNSPIEFFRDDRIELDLVFNDPVNVRLRAVDDDGSPLANAKVRLWNADPVPGVVRELFGSYLIVNRMGFETLYDSRLVPEELVHRTTNDDGWFEFAAMPSDCEFRIQVRPSGFAERMIFVTTGKNYRSEYETLYNSGQDVIFPRTAEVTVSVTFGDMQTPAPNVWVHGGDRNGRGARHGSTDEAGQLVLNLPPGDCRFEVLPEYRTPYVFVDDDSLRLNVENGKKNTFEIVLQRAAELEVHVADTETGGPVAGADLWTLQPDGQTKRSHSWRSFEQPNIVHQGPRYSDDDGVIRTFIAPGQHSLGLCDYQTPEGYEATAVADAIVVECKASEKQSVTLKLKRAKKVARFQQSAGVPNAEVPVPIRYPYCIVNSENLLPRPLAEAVAAFNRTAQESPTGVSQPPVTEQETRAAITKSAEEKHVPAAVRVQLDEILKTGTLPSNVYFRRFTRLDDGRQMQEVWWVRLVVETSDGPVYSVPVRTTLLRARPYTQMERQQNAADGLTLINRFSSYFEEPSNILLLEELPGDSVARLVGQAHAAITAKDLKSFESLFEWNGTSDTTREFVASEFQTLLESTVQSIKVSPRNFRGHLIHWSAFQHYQPNLEIVGYLDIEYTNAGDDAGIRKTLSLEMGRSGDEFRLVNYVPLGERNLPTETVAGLSISGHIEPLADGTHLVTEVITNPGALLSAHLANEEVRLRDFSPDAAESR